jgi:hypothetical protein
MKKLTSTLMLLLVALSMSMVLVYTALYLSGKIPANNYLFVGLLMFNLFTYIWYSEFYNKK